MRIVNYKNYESVLDELREYINEVDSEFVKKCVKAVGKIAIRYEKSVDKCMGILATKVKETRSMAQHAEHVVNEILNVDFILFSLFKQFSENTLPSITLMECFWTWWGFSIMPLSQNPRKLLFGFSESMPNKSITSQWKPLRNGLKISPLRIVLFNFKF